MVAIVKSAVVSPEKVEKSKRGAKIKDYGGLDYDIIPSFLLKEEYESGEDVHLIPNESVWEKNPTSMDMQLFRKLGDDNARDTTKKTLGFRDVVKLLKYYGKEFDWKKNFGISSFMIRFAVADVYKNKKNSLFNHKTIKAAVDVLNSWITKKSFKDPYINHDHKLWGKKIVLSDVA